MASMRWGALGEVLLQLSCSACEACYYVLLNMHCHVLVLLFCRLWLATIQPYWQLIAAPTGTCMLTVQWDIEGSSGVAPQRRPCCTY